MSKSVSVILNSNNAISGNTQKSEYFIDWNSVLDKNKSYIMHFTYLGGQNTYTASKLPCLYLSFNTNSYITSTTANTIRTQMIGFLKPIVFGGSGGGGGSENSCYLQADYNTNLPLYVEAGSMSPNFSVSILTSANPPLPYTDTATLPPAQYVLSLRFTESP
jgi:hypothetical protein